VLDLIGVTTHLLWHAIGLCCIAINEALVGRSEPAENDGNFRALLRYRMRGGDVALYNHLTGAAANATYLSATIQNELLVVAADIIREKYRSEFVRQAAGH